MCWCGVNSCSRAKFSQVLLTVLTESIKGKNLFEVECEVTLLYPWFKKQKQSPVPSHPATPAPLAEERAGLKGV